jgi:hypothetical protein
MSRAPDDPRTLAKRVLQRHGQQPAQGPAQGPQPELSERIRACRCGEGTRAGLFLLGGDWQRAHEAAQALETPLGAHWHALVHRHEPDYPNSRYWLGQAGQSPIYPRLAEAARAAGQAGRVAPGGVWDPLRFTDCYADPAHDAWTRPLDALEQRALLEHCLEQGL